MKTYRLSLSIFFLFVCLAMAAPSASANKKGHKNKASKGQSQCCATQTATVDFTEIPQDAQLFVTSNFTETTPSGVVKKMSPVVYMIDLDNGYELEFDEQGQWLEVEAPDDEVLTQAMLQTILPATSFNYLVEKGLAEHIEEISFNPLLGYFVKTDKKTMLGLEKRKRVIFFNLDGAFTKLPRPERHKK